MPGQNANITQGPTNVGLQVGIGVPPDIILDPSGATENWYAFDNKRVIAFDCVAGAMARTSGDANNAYIFVGEITYPRKIDPKLSPTKGYPIAVPQFWAVGNTDNTGSRNLFAQRYFYYWELMSNEDVYRLRSQQQNLEY